MKKNFWIIVLICAIALVLVVSFLIYNKTGQARRKLEKITAEKIEVRLPSPPRIAIVIDDLGYNHNNVARVFKLGVPVTLSILPNLNYSKSIALEAKIKNYETILHLPLEPLENKKPLEKRTILCSMNRDEILRELEYAMSSIPYLSGVSNHMGSKATADKNLMTVIFQRLKRNKLIFLDNLVTPKSVCKDVARKAGIKFAKRSVFLDNTPDVNYIINQIKKLKLHAIKTGYAVGIGHDRDETYAALEGAITQLKKDGIKFVFLSELAN